MKRWLSLVPIAVFFAALNSVSAIEQPGGRILGNTAELAGRIRTFQAGLLKEQVVDGQGRIYAQEFKFWRAGQDKFRMESGQAWFIINGRTRWMTAGKGVQKTTFTKAAGNPFGQSSLIFQFMAGKVETEAFQVKLDGTATLKGEKALILELASSKTGPTERLWVRERDGLPLKSIVRNRGMVDISLTMKDYRINEPIDGRLFVYTGPLVK